MTATTVTFAPLPESNKPVPQKSVIPGNTLQATTPPTFAEKYGQMIFLVICISVAYFLILPLMNEQYDYNVVAD